MLKVRQYLLQTKEWGNTYGGLGCGLDTEACTDSDVGAYLDTKHTVSGAVVMLTKGVVSWHSRLQTVTASGTSEAEYVALSEAVKGVLLLRQVQSFMKPSVRIGAVDVFEDNEGAIEPVVNTYTSLSTKYIDVKHLVRGTCDAGNVRVVYVRTEDQHADLFTKPLDIQKFYKHANTALNVV